MTEPMSQGELGRAVERIELDIREIKTDVKQQAAVYVTRGEFEAWKQGVDREVRDTKGAATTAQQALTTAVTGLRAEFASGLDGIRADIKHQTPQWWVIGALGCSVLSLIVGVVLAIANGS